MQKTSMRELQFVEFRLRLVWDVCCSFVRLRRVRAGTALGRLASNDVYRFARFILLLCLNER